MDYLSQALVEALRIIVSLDREFLAIVLVSLKVGFTSTLLAALAGVPVGVWLA